MTSQVIFLKLSSLSTSISSKITSCSPYNVCVLASLLLSLILVLTRFVNATKERELPPTYPYWIPILAHAIPLGLDAQAFFDTVVKNCKRRPVKLKMFIADMFLLSNSEHITALFSQSQNLTNKAYRKLAVSSMFYLPKEAQNFIYKDFSGINSKPLPGSTISEDQRIEFLTHTAMTKFLTGPGLRPLISRYTQLFQASLSKQGITSEWKRCPDLFTYVQDMMFCATADAIYGENLLRLSPELPQHYLRYDSGMSYLAKGLPRWWVPGAYEARDRCLQAFKRYHQFLRQDAANWRPTGSDMGYDSAVGAEFVRIRQDIWSKTPAINSDAQASEDFGFLWGANHNASHITFWLLTELVKSPQTMSRFRNAVQATGFTSPNVDPICLNNSAYLSSIFSETLRLRSADTVLRGPNHGDIHIDKWIIPRDNTIAISTWTMHNDENAWNTGTVENPHPVREFWDERFIVDEKRKLVGPSKNGIPNGGTGSSEPQFSSDGMQGTFIPFGGGRQICPGRMFAKQEVLFTIAVLVMGYDIEIVGPQPQESFKAFGTGILGPKGEIGFRIRQKEDNKQ